MMNNDLNKIDDLFDDQSNEALEKLGLIFPKTIADLRRIENEAHKIQLEQPERLADPYSFLNKRAFKKNTSGTYDEQEEYSKNLAQAAREGKIITDDIKQKMRDDKLKSEQQKKDGE